MSDEIKLNRDSARGARAQNLLDNELLKEAYDKIETDLVKAWIGSDPRDTDGRERCFHAIHANRKHQGYLKSVVENGKIAQAELKQLADTAERKSRFSIL